MPDLSEPWFTYIVGEIIGSSYTKFVDTIITCPNCKTEIPLSDAFKHEIEDGVLATERARHQRELETAIKEAEIAAITKATDDADRREASLRAEAAEEKERSRKLLSQLEEM